MKQLKITKFPELDYAGSEAFNTLSTNLSFAGETVKKIMITSCHASEGKSYLSMNLMRTLAQRGMKVALVDADLRCSTLARRYRFTYAQRENAGLAQHLAGMCELQDVVYRTNLPGAFILPAGHEVLNSMQLLASYRYGEMMDVLRDEFDIVLVDSPPAGLIVDAIEIARYCDGAVIVVEYNRGRVQDVADVAANLAKTGCKVLGAVMNGVNLKSFRNRKYYYRSERYSAYYHHYGGTDAHAEPEAEDK